MSLLTPLYVLGLLAVSLPVVFHLIRRMPRGEFAFSSLMFLSPSPPRLTRRSRLENILLLVLRGAVLSLLAFAFARPFLRQEVPRNASDAAGARTAIVVDASASMRRGDLWRQAVALVDQTIAKSRPLDQLALYLCDDALRPLIQFEDMAQIHPGQRHSVVSQRLQGLSPTFAGTHLGQGLMDAVDIVNNSSDAAGREQRVARRIVLISDMQQGSRLNALADYPWPEDVELELRPVKLAQRSNAGLHRLAERPASANATGELRVRVSNDAESAVDQFRVQWLDDEGRRVGESTAIYVPAGESRAVRIRRPESVAKRLQLSGDGCDFDNSLYFATRSEAELDVVYVGTDAENDPQGLRYYLQRALTDGLARPIKLAGAAPGESLAINSPAETPLVVATQEPTDEQARDLRQYVESGGRLLLVLTEAKPLTALASILNRPPLATEEAQVDDYAMLGKVEFNHPVFAAMAGPHFNDFTQIHFWKYRRLTAEPLEDANVLARFEGGDPALVEWRRGEGRVYVLTSGWQPGDSQLARSWKFVLLVSALVEGDQTGKSDRVYFNVNEPVPIHAPEAGEELTVIKPDGTKVPLPPAAEAFVGTDLPGIYTYEHGDGMDNFAVNVDPLESRTAPLGAETLEQLGCRLVGPTALAENYQRRQHLQDIQLESRQKLWQWLILAALGIVVAETWLAGRTTKPSLAEGV